MQAFNSYSLHISFFTVLISLSCTLPTHDHNSNNIKQKSSINRGKLSSFSELLLYTELSSKHKNFEQSSSRLRRHAIDFNDFGFLQYIPLYLQDNSISNEAPFKNHNNILLQDRTKSKNMNANVDGYLKPSYSLIIDNLSSQGKHFSRTNDLDQLEAIRKSLHNRFHFRDTRFPSTNSGELWSPLPHNSMISPNTLGHEPGDATGSAYHLNTLISKIPLSTSFHDALRKDDGALNANHNRLQIGQLYHRTGNDVNKDGNENPIDAFYHKDRRDFVNEDTNDGHKEESRNGVKGEDHTNAFDASTATGSEGVSKIDYEFNTPGKRDWRKENRIMKFLRQRAGTAKGRQPIRFLGKTSRLRTSPKSRLRSYDDEIVRRQPLRQPLPFFGQSLTNEPKIPQETCGTNEDGSRPMGCPTANDICLYDSMLCDGRSDCPDGADESFPVCVAQHWANKILQKMSLMENKDTTET